MGIGEANRHTCPSTENAPASASDDIDSVVTKVMGVVSGGCVDVDSGTISMVASMNLGTLNRMDRMRTGMTYLSRRRRTASGLFMDWL